MNDSPIASKPSVSNPPPSDVNHDSLPGPVSSPSTQSQGQTQTVDPESRASMPPPNVQSKQKPIDEKHFTTSQPDESLERVLSIALMVHVELGRKKIPVSKLLKLGAGQVVELEATAGSPLLIYANNTLIAEGEAVVVGDRYGIRVTDIVSPAERVQRLSRQQGKGGG